tara:strand:+ start:103 stop:456 length:354 start_codon:yes stop_codon:yes gene_type:complete
MIVGGRSGLSSQVSGGVIKPTGAVFPGRGKFKAPGFVRGPRRQESVEKGDPHSGWKYRKTSSGNHDYTYQTSPQLPVQELAAGPLPPDGNNPGVHPEEAPVLCALSWPILEVECMLF